VIDDFVEILISALIGSFPPLVVCLTANLTVSQTLVEARLDKFVKNLTPKGEECNF